MDREQALEKLENLIALSNPQNPSDIAAGRALGYLRALLDFKLITVEEFYVYVDRVLGFA